LQLSTVNSAESIFRKIGGPMQRPALNFMPQCWKGEHLFFVWSNETRRCSLLRVVHTYHGSSRRDSKVHVRHATKSSNFVDKVA